MLPMEVFGIVEKPLKPARVARETGNPPLGSVLSPGFDRTHTDLRALLEWVIDG